MLLFDEECDFISFQILYLFGWVFLLNNELKEFLWLIDENKNPNMPLSRRLWNIVKIECLILDKDF
jgi:hypothetical protein